MNESYELKKEDSFEATMLMLPGVQDLLQYSPKKQVILEWYFQLIHLMNSFRDCLEVGLARSLSKILNLQFQSKFSFQGGKAQEGRWTR